MRFRSCFISLRLYWFTCAADVEGGKRSLEYFYFRSFIKASVSDFITILLLCSYQRNWGFSPLARLSTTIIRGLRSMESHSGSLLSLAMWPTSVRIGCFSASSVFPSSLCVSAFYFPIRKGQIKSGDFSYGVYVFHFPVIQIFLAVGIFHRYPLLSVGLIAVIVAGVSFASWHLVEKPYLLGSRAKRQMAQSVMTRV